MGVAPYKTFTFDGVSSADYDVYLTGVGVYNAPKRSVEMFSIAGRNGDYALDQGKFENITVTYRVGMYDTDENNFAIKVSNFRNWLCSKVGYVRLEDEYNPNEYRMATYMDGFELDHDMLIAGEAEITFNCKPQRWLTSGETATAVANNGTLSNPTLFESEPLLAVKGYGTIGFNGYTVSIENIVMGNVILINSMQGNSASVSKTFNTNYINNNDTITFDGATFMVRIARDSSSTPTVPSVSDSNSDFSTIVANASVTNQQRFTFTTTVEPLTFTGGTSQTYTNTVTISGGSVTGSYAVKVQYNGNEKFTLSVTSVSLNYGFVQATTLKGGLVTANSTVSALGNPTYIDCEIGECYMIKNSEIVSLNGVISLGSDLPKLSSGTNTFALDNTVTELKVTPRWWKV